MSFRKTVSLFVSVKKGRVGPTCSGLDPVSCIGCLDAPAVGGVPRESRDTQGWRLGLVPGRTGLNTCLHRGSVVIVNDKRPQVATPNVVAGSPVWLRDFGANTPCILLTFLGVTIQLKAGQSKPSWLGTSVSLGIYDSPRWFSAHCSVSTLLRHCFELFQHSFNIVAPRIVVGNNCLVLVFEETCRLCCKVVTFILVLVFFSGRGHWVQGRPFTRFHSHEVECVVCCE